MSGAGSANDAPAARPAPPVATPSLRRRMAAFTYEGVLLFGVWMVTGFIYTGLTQMRDESQGRSGLMATLALVTGIYFTWFWSRGGQTVAMKAWHIRLVTANGGPVPPMRAAVRYVLAWLWFAPALLAAHASGLRSGASLLGIVAAGVLAYAALAFLNPHRQFWHDVVCGTRLADARPAKTPAA
ncbi:MAG: RDD family protein [Burkholderiaceae bacterium]